jgi:hypothetical protein
MPSEIEAARKACFFFSLRARVKAFAKALPTGWGSASQPGEGRAGFAAEGSGKNSFYAAYARVDLCESVALDYSTPNECTTRVVLAVLET